MNFELKAEQLAKGEGKVKRFGVFDDVGVCVRIFIEEKDAKDLAEKWSVPSPFGFADEHIDYTYKEIWV